MIILPTFEVREKLTAEKMNAFRDAVEAKFTGGITPADFAWPFVLQGDIDFADTYQILNLKTFWNLINAAEYTSLQLACDAAASAGGGTVVIPPDTEITTNGVNLNSSLVAIMGFGPSSVLKLSNGSSSGYFFRTATGGLTDIQISNLALDGQATGTAQAAVIARRVNRFTMERVDIKNFTGPFITITHDGVAGQSCQNVVLSDIRLSGGTSASANHIKVEDCIGLVLHDVFSDTCPASAIVMEPTGGAGILRDISGDTIRVNTPTGKGISILGASGTSDVKWSNIGLVNCQVRGSTGDAFELGTASKLLQDIRMLGCQAPTSGAKALRVAAERGTITGNHLIDATTVGIDMQNSIDLVVNGNNCRDATTIGIDADNTTTCEVYDNNVQDSPETISRSTATGLRVHNNIGARGVTIGTAYSDNSSQGLSTGTYQHTVTFPANSLRTGDVIRVVIRASSSGNVDGLALRLGGVTVITTATFIGTDSVFWDVLIKVGDDPATTSSFGLLTKPLTSSTDTGSVTTVDLSVDTALEVVKGGVTDTITVSRFFVYAMGGI